ncbi:MAG: DUF420 domain-containing protein [Planctomycetaceae bacterium]
MSKWLFILVVISLGGHATLADDAADPTAPQPIVVELSDSEEPTVVELGEAQADPLLIEPFELIDQNGEPFSSEELAGHPWVASFIFTKCAGYCPVLVRNMKLEIADRVKDPNVRYVTITVDPEYDTPEKLKQYAEIYGVDPEKWKFLTGDKETIYRIVQHGFRLPVYEMQGEDRQPGFEVAHSLSLIHVGPDGRVVGKYDSRESGEVLSLRRVLNGQIETPEENLPIVGEQPAQEGSEDKQTVSPPGESGAPIAAPEAVDEEPQLPSWVARLPTTNAMLNGLATALLLVGFVAVKLKNVRLHKRMMLMAFGTSIAFLACYLTYHLALHHYTGTHGKPFDGTGPIRTVYFALLISHVVLAAAVPVLAIITIARGLREQWDAHRRIARVTFPIWLYVSVTGVIIYGMLYHWPIG